MAMLTVRIDDELSARLTALAEKSGHTKSYFLKQLLSDAIDDLEEDQRWFEEQTARILAERASGKKRKYTSHEDLLKELGQNAKLVS